MDKKHKRFEVEAILRKKAQRAAVDKPSSFKLRGRVVDLEDAERYSKRAKLVVGAQVIGNGPATPKDLVCHTPPSERMIITAPVVFSRPEKVFWDVEAYVKGRTCHAFARCSATDAPSGALHTPISLSIASRRPTRCADRCFETTMQGIAEFEADGQYLTICKWNDALGMLGAVVRSQHHSVLVKVMDCILELSRSGHVAVATMLRNHFANMAAIVLPVSHSTKTVYGDLKSLELDGFEEVRDRMRHELAQAVENEYATVALVLIRKTDLDKQLQAEDTARSLQSCLEALPVADSSFGPNSFRQFLSLHLQFCIMSLGGCRKEAGDVANNPRERADP